MSKQKCVKCGLRKAIAHSDKCFRCANWQWNKPAREAAIARSKREARKGDSRICAGCGRRRNNKRFLEPGYAGILRHACPAHAHGTGGGCTGATASGQGALAAGWLALAALFLLRRRKNRAEASDEQGLRADTS